MLLKTLVITLLTVIEQRTFGALAAPGPKRPNQPKEPWKTPW